MTRPELTPAQQARAAERRRNHDRLEAGIRRVIQEIAPRLYDGEPGAGLTSEELDRIEATFSGARSIYRVRAVRRVLRRILRDLERTTGGAVAKPAVEVTIRRKPSPFAGSAVARVCELSALMDRFIDSIMAEPWGDASVEAGRIVLSAVVFGGLLCPQLLDALPEALRSGIHANGDLFWIEFPLEGEQIRRWFPDPVTGSLILRWVAASRDWPVTRSTRELLVDQVRLLSATDPHSPFELSQLIHAAETRLRILIPGLLVDHLATVRHGQSLPARAWWRLMADYHLASEITPDEHEEDAPELGAQPVEPDHIKPPGAQSEDADPLASLRQFMRALRGPDSNFLRSKTGALRRLQLARDAQPDASSMLACVMGWAIWLLQPGRSGVLRPSSVYRYLGAIAGQVLKFAGEVAPDDLSTEELESLYEAVLQATRSRQGREMAVSCLRSFHSYLMFNHGADPAAIDGELSADQAVRANLVSDREYQALRKAIQGSGYVESLVGRLDLMIVLLYRLGLRKNELRYLCLRDLQIDEQGNRPLLWVHGHPQRQLKTTSSTRRLPLRHLLTAGEWGHLHAYRDLRTRECMLSSAPGNALLFPMPGSDTEPMSEHLMEYLVSVMRAVCGDSSLVLHSLRHSFLTNLFADVMLAGLVDSSKGDLEQVFAEWMPWRRTRTCRNPLKALFATQRLPANAAYTMAVLAGHIGPSETLHTYIHLQDYLACLYLRRDAERHPVALWAALEGVGVNAMHVRHSRHRKSGGREVIAHVDTPRRLLRKCRMHPPQGALADRSQIPRLMPSGSGSGLSGLTLDATYRALSTDRHFVSAKARELLTGIPTDDYQRLSRNARFLASLSTDARNRGARRSRLLIDHPPRRAPPISRRPQLDSVGPAIPKKRLDREQARTVFSRALADPSVRAEDLLELLLCASRSKPWLRITNTGKAAALVRLLSRLGVPYAQQELVLVTLPPGCLDAKRRLAEVRQEIAIDACTVRLSQAPARMKCSNRANPQGVLHLSVRQSARRSTGWRVGCYYAACVLATESCIDWTGGDT